MTLKQAAGEIARRLVGLFPPDGSGARLYHGDDRRFAHDPDRRELVLFYEYFHGNTGRGCGASHQTRWTVLVTHCLEIVAAERAGRERKV